MTEEILVSMVISQSLHNISFRLLLDVARWYSLNSTTQMIYSDESMKFWKIIYRLFHGKVLRFFSGTKSVGQVLDGSSVKGNFDPQLTSINFAVPNVNSINRFDVIESNIPREMPPGIIRQAIDLMPRSKSYVLSVDGKKGTVPELIVFKRRQKSVLSPSLCSLFKTDGKISIISSVMRSSSDGENSFRFFVVLFFLENLHGAFKRFVDDGLDEFVVKGVDVIC